MMKQLLKDIVKKMTENLLGKSVINSPSERQTHNSSHSVCIEYDFILYFFIHFNNRVNYLFDLLYLIIMIIWINMESY